LKTFLLLLLTAGSTLIGVSSADADPNSDAIRATALNYIDGFYTGDGTRMEKALHPELAKRIVTTDPKTGKSTLGQMSAMTLVQRTRAGIGKRFPENKRQHDVTILDRFDDTAMVKIVATEWIDYLQMAKFDGEWKIINVLWVLKPNPKSAQAGASDPKPSR
jgi:putative lumazine-binding protein